VSTYKKNHFATSGFKKSVLALAVLHCSPLLAATDGSAPKEDTLTVTADNPAYSTNYSASEASVAGKSKTPINEIPQSVSVVTPSMINDYQITSLDEAMKFVSGVTQGNTLG